MARTVSIVCIMNGLGDAFLALGAIRAMRSHVGAASLFILTVPELKDTVFAEFRDNLLAVERRPELSQENRARIEELAKAVIEFDDVCWYSLNSYYPKSQQEDLAIKVVKPAKVVALSDVVFDQRTKRLIAKPMREAFYASLQIPCGSRNSRCAPSISPLHGLRASRFIKHAFASGLVPVAAHADTEKEKRWPVRSWIALAWSLRAIGFGLVMLGRPEGALTRCPAIVAVNKVSWRDQVAILSHLRLFIGVDSCFAHVADGLRIPGVVLFGPSCDQVWGPQGGALKVLIAPGRKLGNLPVGEVLRQFRHHSRTSASRSMI